MVCSKFWPTPTPRLPVPRRDIVDKARLSHWYGNCCTLLYNSFVLENSFLVPAGYYKICRKRGKSTRAQPRSPVRYRPSSPAKAPPTTPKPDPLSGQTPRTRSPASGTHPTPPQIQSTRPTVDGSVQDAERGNGRTGEASSYKLPLRETGPLTMDVVPRRGRGVCLPGE